MSDRRCVIDLSSGVREQGIELFLDGECGTWRLFLTPSFECVDFSLEALRSFHAQLSNILKDIEVDPDTFNAEIRRSWQKREDERP